MEAACRGVHESGGLAVGILPGEREEANSYVDIAIVTGMGQARNAVIVKSADAVVALPGEMGTLSEMALALKMKKPLISLGSWELPGALEAKSPEEAMELLDRIKQKSDAAGSVRPDRREKRCIARQKRRGENSYIWIEIPAYNP
jgi:uncharacterized protein (TIGR00725 family)